MQVMCIHFYIFDHWDQVDQFENIEFKYLTSPFLSKLVY